LPLFNIIALGGGNDNGFNLGLYIHGACFNHGSRRCNMQKVINYTSKKIFKIIEESEDRIVLMDERNLVKAIKPKTFKNQYGKIDKGEDNE
jgi:hypothetical protein